MAPTPGGTKTIEGKELLEKFTVNTDLDVYSERKKLKLFEAASTAMNESKGTMSKEMKKLVDHMVKSFKKMCEENEKLKMNNRELMSEREKIIEDREKLNETNVQLNQQLEELKQPAIPNANTKSYSNAVKNKRDEFVVLVKKKRDFDGDKDLRTELIKKIKPIEKNIDIERTKFKSDTLVIHVKDTEQQRTLENCLKGDNEIECNLPKKRIPSIKIKEVDSNMDADDILRELKDKENIDIEKATVKIILKNPNYRTNRAVINLSEEDTVRISKQKRIKMGPLMHPFEIDYGVIQCKNCNKFGHFHRSKDKNTVICKSRSPVCVHCGGEHDLKDCLCRSDRSKAKCSNCGGNHRAYDEKCTKRTEVINKVKDKFVC